MGEQPTPKPPTTEQVERAAAVIWAFTNPDHPWPPLTGTYSGLLPLLLVEVKIVQCREQAQAILTAALTEPDRPTPVPHEGA